MSGGRSRETTIPLPCRPCGHVSLDWLRPYFTIRLSFAGHFLITFSFIHDESTLEYDISVQLALGPLGIPLFFCLLSFESLMHSK